MQLITQSAIKECYSSSSSSLLYWGRSTFSLHVIIYFAWRSWSFPFVLLPSRSLSSASNLVKYTPLSYSSIIHQQLESRMSELRQQRWSFVHFLHVLDVEDSISLKIGLERYPSSKTLIGVSNGDDDPSVQGLWNAYQTQLSHSGMEWIDAVKATRTITDSFLGLIEQTDVNYVNTQVMVGATFAGSGSESSRKVEATGWFNNQAYHTAPLSLNLIHNALLMQRTNNNSYRLTITNHPLPFDLFMRVEAANSKDGDGSIGFKISNTLVLGMAFLAGSFILSLGFDSFHSYLHDILWYSLKRNFHSSHKLFLFKSPISCHSNCTEPTSIWFHWMVVSSNSLPIDWTGSLLIVWNELAVIDCRFLFSERTSDKSQTPAVRFWRRPRHILDGKLTLGFCEFHYPMYLNNDHVCGVQRPGIGVCGSVRQNIFTFPAVYVGHPPAHVPLLLSIRHTVRRIHQNRLAQSHLG